jgi:hypothetical protein
MDNSIKKLKNEHKLYLEEARKVKRRGLSPDYWEGKASGLLLAIEILQKKCKGVIFYG